MASKSTRYYRKNPKAKAKKAAYRKKYNAKPSEKKRRAQLMILNKKMGRKGDGKDVEILYLSERVGLTPFVEGLLQGLAQRFNQSMEIMGIEPQSVEIGEKTLFKVRMG